MTQKQHHYVDNMDSNEEASAIFRVLNLETQYLGYSHSTPIWHTIANNLYAYLVPNSEKLWILSKIFKCI
jgi:hypothetical protein